MASPVRLLLLGGTAEARALAAALAGRHDVFVINSLAGVTAAPRLPAGRLRRGGFGGTGGLADYLTKKRIDLLIDATHPYATAISRHAAISADEAGVPRLLLSRPPWQPQPGDNWHEVASASEAAARLPELGTMVFLTLGRRDLAPFAVRPGIRYLVRSVDPIEPGMLPGMTAEFIEARGPFDLAAERALMRRHGIDCLVCRNSGGSASHAKIDVARELRLPVLMLRRPPPPPGDGVPDIAAALAWIEARRRPPAR